MSARCYVIHEYYYVRWIFHGFFPQLCRGGLSRRVITADFRPFPFFFVQKSQESDAVSTRDVCTRVKAPPLFIIRREKRRNYFPIGLLLLIISLCALGDVRSSGHRRKKYRRPIFIRRGKLSAAVFRSRLSRCVLSRCVLLTLFHYRWAGRGFGQVDTPNPRTVRNRGWCLTGVRAWKAFFFLFHAAWCFDSHSILINLQIIWLDIAKKYVGTIFNSKIHRNVERAFNDTII